MLNVKFISSLEKVFLDQSIDDFKALESISALRGERLSLQLIYAFSKDDKHRTPLFHTPILSGALAKYATVRNVKQVALTKYDGDETYESLKDYLRYPPGLFPDILSPLTRGDLFAICDKILESLWIDIDIPSDMEAGKYELCVKIDNVEEITSLGKGEPLTVAEAKTTIEVIGATLPEQKLIHTEWFYTDCIATYHNLTIWSEEHWAAIEKYARVAVRNGINMLLTPVFTPPLDTAIGGERPTTQLVGIKKSGNRYTFNFKLLDRWIEMCDRVGIKYFEVSHLFTQWGATSAPKIMATENGEYKKIFGWETNAHSDEYKKFLRAFLKAFIKHMKEKGCDTRCFFHISDEPHKEQLANYKKSKRIVEGLLKDYVIMDALSAIDFYKKGVTKTPIPTTWHAHEFLDEGINLTWTYYCGGCPSGYSSRMLAKPSYMNRSLGMQMYKYNISGFLHWGYNFYNSRRSVGTVNPYIDVSSEKWVPAGDTALVYPSCDAGALESIRILTFHEGIQDMRAMQLCESYYSHEEVVSAIEEALGRELRFNVCAASAEEMLKVRERVNSLIKAAICK